MLVRWKVLFTLGFIVWFLLCIVDYFFGDVNKITKITEEDKKIFDVIDYVEDRIEPEIKRSVVQNDLSITQWIFWNMGVFLTTVFGCFALKAVISIRSLLNYTNSETTQTFVERMVGGNRLKRSNSSSRIPVPITKTSSIFKQSSQDIDFKNDITSSCFSLSTISTEECKDLDKQSEISRKSELFIPENKESEKQCNRLRNEMMHLQSSSLKEQAALNKKVELIGKERRELAKQLTVARKENRTLKNQLEELISEKGMLLKRLESAAREFKVNIKSKKAAMERLEQAECQIQTLTEQLDFSNKQKEILDRQLKQMEQELINLNGKISNESYLGKPSMEIFDKSADFSSDTEEGKVNKTPLKEPNNNAELSPRPREVSQNRVAVQKVQMRLFNLEKSLERFREQTLLKKDDPTTTSAPNSPKQQSELTTEDSPPEVPGFIDRTASDYLEMNDFLNRTDNLTDEQRQEILKPQTPKMPANIELEENIPPSIPELASDHSDISEHCPQSQVNLMLSLFKSVKGKVEVRGDEFCTDDESVSIVSTTMSSQVDEESKEDCDANASSSQKRIVSSSPAFQKFLKNLDGIEKKTTAILNHIF
ncbi:intracellular protein transport protein USO1-like isoform X1 [Agrilus planipennis]|uniref:Intracellular protein transport protein USO1-like isoform X1 n=1 Tax=Agrilus planipennis TaxID=224129 RepID=A0A1W4WDI4_AGRPL|nr:intracellular protein transport protein USO1-like isoform X1 [Agrilus planipennis]